MARLPPSRHAVHRRLRIPDLRAGDDSPLSNTFCPAALAACAFRRLPTQRIRHCGLNGTYQTRSRPCAKGSRSLSLEPFLDVHAANAASDTLHRSRTPSPYLGICDTVELEHDPKNWLPVFRAANATAFVRRVMPRPGKCPRSHEKP